MVDMVLLLTLPAQTVLLHSGQRNQSLGEAYGCINTSIYAGRTSGWFDIRVREHIASSRTPVFSPTPRLFVHTFAAIPRTMSDISENAQIIAGVASE